MTEVIQNTIDVNTIAKLAKASYCTNSEGGKVDPGKALRDKLGKNTEWKVLEYDLSHNGHQAVSYARDTDGDGIYDDVVIAYRGTDSPLDILVDDLQIALKQVPKQKNKALSFYNQVMKTEKGQLSTNVNIVITGHSLGGALAQLVGAEKNVETITFNAPGMLNNVDGSKSYEKVTNYVNLNDWVGCYLDHVGNTKYYLPDGFVSKDKNDNDTNFAPHSDYLHDANYNELYNVDITEDEWDVSYAASLWGYDVENGRAGLQQLIASFKASPENLKKAVALIQERIGSKDKLEKLYHYLTIDGTNYILGDKKDNFIEVKNTAIGTKEYGIVWGNGGDDIIKGIENNDILIGGKDNDSIYGGKGNDILIAGGQNLTLEEITNLTQNKNFINSSKFETDNSNNKLDGGAGNDHLVQIQEFYMIGA